MFVSHKGVRQYPFAFDMFSHLFHRHRRAHQSWWRNLWALSPFCVAIVDLFLQKDHHFRHPAVDVAKTNQRRDYLLSIGPFAAELVLYSLLHPLLLRRCWMDWPNQVLEHSSIRTSATRNMHWQLVLRPSYFVREGEWLYLGPRCPELLKGSWWPCFWRRRWRAFRVRLLHLEGLRLVLRSFLFKFQVKIYFIQLY